MGRSGRTDAFMRVRRPRPPGHQPRSSTPRSPWATTTVETLDGSCPRSLFASGAPLPWEAAFLAGKAFERYRRSGGTRRSPLPDFYIGAHAAVAGMSLLTRDASRYRTYFPTVELIAPDA